MVAFVTVERHGASGDPLDRLQSMRHPAADAALDREQALGVAEDFVTRFNTYGPQLLAKDHTMPKYEALTNEMSSKFAAVFSKWVPAAEVTVYREHVRRQGQVYAAGVSTIDGDTAQVIVAGTVTFGYPNPRKKGAWLDSAPERFRYQVSLVKQHGSWLVDDFDDLDDNLPSFGQSNGGQVPGSTGLAPSDAPSGTTGSGAGTGGSKAKTGGAKR
ncbi:MAG: hypothetical protein FWD95_15265 [Nocardioidaceae bacterium]|nr:hypothetical protein [Nocardioidaceae bacterium]